MEWDSIRPGDFLYLLAFKGGDEKKMNGVNSSSQRPLCLEYVRGCTVSSFIDHNGNPIEDSFFFSNENIDRSTGALSSDRTLSVFLEPEQYHLDSMKFKKHESEDISKSFNILLRREGSSDAYISWLSCIRQLLKEDVILPDWLYDLFLGYGEKKSADLSRHRTIDFHDTFLNVKHVEESFPNWVCFPRFLSILKHLK